MGRGSKFVWSAARIERVGRGECARTTGVRAAEAPERAGACYVSGASARAARGREKRCWGGGGREQCEVLPESNGDDKATRDVINGIQRATSTTAYHVAPRTHYSDSCTSECTGK